MSSCTSSNRSKEFQVIGLLTVWLLAGCAGYAAGILYSTTGSEVLALATSSLLPAHRLGITQADFEGLRFALATAGLLGLLGAAAGYYLRWSGRAAALPVRKQGQQAGDGLRSAWHALAPRQRRGALATFAALTVLRILVSRFLVTVDDSASYEFFVRKSLFVVSAYYPAPNNHVFSNTLSWLFYQVCPAYWWSMRVPVVLVSTGGTAYWFLGLLRRSNFRVAAVAVTLFSLLELSLFLAAEGRGYALLMLLSAWGFFSAIALAEVPAAAPAPTKAWAGLAIAGTVGLYTVPTFAYFLVAAYSWLGFCWLRTESYRRLINLALLGVATLTGAALLYAPLLLVSGPGALFHNEFVRPQAIAAFWHGLPAYWWGVEGGLMGESHNGVMASLHLGSLAAVAAAVGFLILVRAARSGRLPAREAGRILHLGVPAFWFWLLPYALLVMQRVQAPDRTLAFKAVFMFLLIGLESDWLLRRFELKSRQLRAMLLLGVGVWAGVQLIQLYRSNELRLSYLRTPHLAAQWLLSQPPGPILVPDSPGCVAALRFYSHFENPTATLTIDETPRPGIRYRYVVTLSATPLAPASTAAALPHLHIARDVNCEALDIVAYW